VDYPNGAYMRITLVAAAIGAAFVLSACSEKMSSEKSQNSTIEAKAAIDHENLLLSRSPLQDQAPQFDKIKMSDYEPAYALGFQQQEVEIDAIAYNEDAASFDNTIVAMETSGELLARVNNVFSNLSGLISDKEFQRIEAEMAPKLSAHSDNIFLNETLFKRVQSIYQQRDGLSAEDQRLIAYYNDKFVRAGAKLDEKSKTRMREINSELSILSTDFSQNILKSFKEDTILVTDKAQLAGLSENDIASLASAAKDAGKEGYMITLVNTTRQPVLSSLENRQLRQKVWETSANRAMANNGPILLKLVKLRAEKANLLGYVDWASYVSADQMAQTPEAIFGILDDLAPKAVAKAKAEAAEIQAIMKSEGADFEMMPWDWAYYADKVRAAKYDLDESLLKPYFEFNTVLHDGLFFAMEKLYGITFKDRKDLPVWNDTVLAFEVFNEDGSSIGLFYLDPYAREGKSGGAWMSEFMTQSWLLNNKPVVYNAQNIPKPAEGQPTLMTFSEVTTMFHEFGHATHGLFSQVKYPSLAGTATARDFVEFPSQFNEDWDIDPLVLANYAKHYQTGEPIPQALLDKVLASHKYGQGYDTTEYLAASLLDMEWHTLPADASIQDVEQFEQKALAKHGIAYMAVPARYKSAYFSHIFAGGYSAGYYAYLWTEVFAADAFGFMAENGGLNRANGDSFREKVLSMGNSQDLMQDYINFRGQKPTTDALLKRRGLVD
jgi:peptidyl-dipeptidase Dcp